MDNRNRKKYASIYGRSWKRTCTSLSRPPSAWKWNIRRIRDLISVDDLLREALECRLRDRRHRKLYEFREEEANA
jgi:hypothetical protein